jgi:YidC/Oxa1 family membrane protein insertase
MGQQFYVIRRMPAPGSLAEKALNERRAKRGEPTVEANGTAKAAPEKGSPEALAAESDGPLPEKRIQPKKQSKSKRSGTRPKTSGP